MGKYCCSLEGAVYTGPSAAVNHTYHFSERQENGYTGTSFAETHNENYEAVSLFQGGETYEQRMDHHLKPAEQKMEDHYEKFITESLREEHFNQETVTDGQPTAFVPVDMSGFYKDPRLDDLLRASSKPKESHALDRRADGWTTNADGCCK